MLFDGDLGVPANDEDRASSVRNTFIRPPSQPIYMYTPGSAGSSQFTTLLSPEDVVGCFNTKSTQRADLSKTIQRCIEGIVMERGPEGRPVRWCYIPMLPTGVVSGKCLSLDFGCSDHYFQVALCNVKHRRGCSNETDFEPTDNQAFVLTRTIRYAHMDKFSDFVALCVGKVIQDNKLDKLSSNHEPIFMGVAAGFDARVKPQMTPASASVPLTYKDYCMPGFIGKDFVAKFQAAFDRAKINVKIVTVLNDTVSTLLSGVNQVFHRSDANTDCSIGVVSTRGGSNLAYLETNADFLDQCSEDSRLLLRRPRGNGYCAVVNSESGMWVGRWNELRQHANSMELYLQDSLDEPIRFECVASGFWYPRLLRRCFAVLRLGDAAKLSPSKCFEIFARCDRWQPDKRGSVTIARNLELATDLKNIGIACGSGGLSAERAVLVAQVCQAVVGRTADVLAAGVMAVARIVYGSKLPRRMAVAYGGSMFRLAQLRPMLEASLRSMVGEDTEIILLHADVAFGCAVSAITAGKIMHLGSL